jgi:acyl-CoA thioesterase
VDTFDEALLLSGRGAGEYAALASPAFEGSGAMFGGWTAALMLRAALAEAGPGQRALSIVMQYLRRVPAGAALGVKVECLKAGRTLSQWRCDLHLADSGALAATAQICTGAPLPSETYQDVQMPAVSGPAALDRVAMDFSCFENVDMRFETGDKWFGKDITQSLVWAKFMDDAPLDAARLAFLADVSPPRSYYVMDRPRPTPTVTMTVNFYATSNELAATAAEFVLCDLLGTRMEESYTGATGRIWSAGGRLLATTEQLQWSPAPDLARKPD